VEKSLTCSTSGSVGAEARFIFTLLQRRAPAQTTPQSARELAPRHPRRELGSTVGGSSAR
jgi:hypothetical protein